MASPNNESATEPGDLYMLIVSHSDSNCTRRITLRGPQATDCIAFCSLSMATCINPILHGLCDIRYYTGGGSTNPTGAKSFVRQPICILGLKIGYQYNILVFSNP